MRLTKRVQARGRGRKSFGLSGQWSLTKENRVTGEVTEIRARKNTLNGENAIRQVSNFLTGGTGYWKASSTAEPDTSNIALRVWETFDQTDPPMVVHGEPGQTITHQLVLDLVPPANDPGNSLTYTFIDDSDQTYNPIAVAPLADRDHDLDEPDWISLATFLVPQSGPEAWGSKSADERWTFRWTLTVEFGAQTFFEWSTTADYLILAACVGPVGGISLFDHQSWSLLGTDDSGAEPTYDEPFVIDPENPTGRSIGVGSLFEFARTPGAAFTLRGERLSNGASPFLSSFSQLAVAAGVNNELEVQVTLLSASIEELYAGRDPFVLSLGAPTTETADSLEWTGLGLIYPIEWTDRAAFELVALTAFYMDATTVRYTVNSVNSAAKSTPDAEWRHLDPGFMLAAGSVSYGISGPFHASSSNLVTSGPRFTNPTVAWEPATSPAATIAAYAGLSQAQKDATTLTLYYPATA